MGWTTTGVYQRVLEAANGADSLVITNLEVNPVYNITEEITITELPGLDSVRDVSKKFDFHFWM